MLADVVYEVSELDGAQAGDDDLVPAVFKLDGPPRRADPDAAERAHLAYGWRRDELHNALLDSLALDNLPDPEPVVDGLLMRDSLGWLHGKPGHGKSFVALDIAGCVAAGLPWQGRGVLQGPVFYIIAEGVTGLRERVRAWENYTVTRCGVDFLPIAVQLLNRIDVQAVAELAQDLEPVLVVIDTQARVTVGAEENSARDMGQLVAALDSIRASTRACVLVVHHEARAAENMRGSTALEGAATTILRLEKDGPRLTLTNPKQKDGPEADPIPLRLVPRLASAVVQAPGGPADDDNENARKIITTLREQFGQDGAPATRLHEATGLSKSTFYRMRTRLVQSGDLVNIGTSKRPHYVLREHHTEPL